MKTATGLLRSKFPSDGCSIACRIRKTAIYLACIAGLLWPWALANAAPQPFCGIYCIYCAAKLEGGTADLADLMQDRYVGNRVSGSSITELQFAAADHQLSAVPLENLTISDLQSSHYLLILHVKGNRLSTTFDHFILFLWAKNGMARIIDPMSTVRRLSFARLDSIWDGSALAVSAQPIHAGEFTRTPWGYCAFGSVVILAFGGLSSSAAKRFQYGFSGGRRKYVELPALLLLALVLGCWFEYASGGGLLRNPDVIRAIQNDHAFSFLPRVSVTTVAKCESGGAVLIDARLSQDYALGHIGNAINFPVNAASDQSEAIERQIPKNARLIVYCQSQGCPFSRDVAFTLLDDGYRNISVFPGGWLEWASTNGISKNAQ